MNTLADSIAQKRKDNQTPDACIIEATSSEVVAFIEFQPDQRTRFGFNAGQLMQYRLDTRIPGNDPEEQPQVLTLGFPTADVIISGRQLNTITKLLTEGRLKSTIAYTKRHASLHPHAPFVADIVIQSIQQHAQYQST